MSTEETACQNAMVESIAAAKSGDVEVRRRREVSETGCETVVVVKVENGRVSSEVRLTDAEAEQVARALTVIAGGQD